MSSHNTPADLGTGEKTLGIYLFGVFLCVVLTLIPFAAVMYHFASHAETLLILCLCAIAQFLVQVICFLRLNVRTLQGQYNVYAFIFSIVVLVVVIGGSLWIMWHLDYNMMH